jgi:type I restriction enzyme S subunit
LVKRGIIEKPLDGNHGEIHPKSEDFVNSGIPFIMASDINNGAVDYINCKFITKKQADNLRKGFAKSGDVLLTHKATIGRTAIIKYDEQPYVMLTPQVTYYRVRDQQKLDRQYLRYFFEGPFFQDTLCLWASSGSTRAYLGITEQGKLPFVLPPINKQRKIAAIISAYDELIENNQRRIALLEKMAEEIYREWFVRLRFPGHEKVKIVKGIPEGWGFDKASMFFSLAKGKSYAAEELTDDTGQMPFINLKSFNRGRWLP